MPCADSPRVQAYFDGELDAPAAAETERHCEGCAECRELLADLGRLRTALRTELAHPAAPAALRGRIMRALDRESEVRAGWRMPPFWQGALGGIGASVLAAGLAFFLYAPRFADPMLDELVSAHVRSLMPEHLVDVVSTDKHTVKPWFAGHTDVSPVVADFAPEGYRLVGGRADYFDRQRAAAVVYQHGAHVINVFSWASDRRAVPKNATRNGYHLAFWKSGNLVYCAVSDTGWDELLPLAALLREKSAQDAE